MQVWYVYQYVKGLTNFNEVLLDMVGVGGTTSRDHPPFTKAMAEQAKTSLG